MGDWNLLGSILEEVHAHSTMVGKIWLTILFIFRMLVLGVAAEDVWVDEQSQFVCNTEQPGCRNVCYDSAFPISLIRFWVLQIVFVSSPSLVYVGHALYRLRELEKERHRRKAQLRAELEETEPLLEEHKKLERELKKLEEQKKMKKAPLQGSLLRTYVIHILTRSVVEVGFIMAQYILYGIGMDPLYKCETLPCPNMVDCYVSRPTEKTIFMVFMIVIACVSLFLNLLEISHLGLRKIKQILRGMWSPDDTDSLGKHKSTVQQLCVLSSLSPHRRNTGYIQPGQMSEGHLGMVDPPPLYLAAVDTMPGAEQQRDSNFDDAGGGGGHPSSIQPQQTRQQRLASQGRIQGLRFQMDEPQQTLRAGVSESQLHVQQFIQQQQSGYPGESQSSLAGQALHGHEGQQHRGSVLPNHIPAALVSALPPHLVQHRPSRVLDLAPDSSDSDLPYAPQPRKASFMARLPSDSGSSNISSCPTIHSSESELGSLSNMPMNPPPGGRRMSMSVFLDISSIMKK